MFSPSCQITSFRLESTLAAHTALDTHEMWPKPSSCYAVLWYTLQLLTIGNVIRWYQTSNTNLNGLTVSGIKTDGLIQMQTLQKAETLQAVTMVIMCLLKYPAEFMTKVKQP